MTTDLDIALSDVEDARRLILAPIGLSFLGQGFESLDFRLEKLGVLIDEMSFDDLASALACFDGALFPVGATQASDLDLPLLRATFVVSVVPFDAFGMQLAYAIVPEPASALLLGLGLLALAGRRRTRTR